MENSLYRKRSFRDMTWYEMLLKRRQTRTKFWRQYLIFWGGSIWVSLVWMYLDGSVIDSRFLILFLSFVLYVSFWPLNFRILYRLHDTGRSALWSLLGFIPIVGTLKLIYLLSGDSQKGSNKWGRDLND